MLSIQGTRKNPLPGDKKHKKLDIMDHPTRNKFADIQSNYRSYHYILHTSCTSGWMTISIYQYLSFCLSETITAVWTSYQHCLKGKCLIIGNQKFNFKISCLCFAIAHINILRKKNFHPLLKLYNVRLNCNIQRETAAACLAQLKWEVFVAAVTRL